jgi:hypothetical protein
MESNLPREVVINPDAPEPRRVPRFLLILLGVPLLCALTCVVCYWFTELRPQYVELSIPPSEEMIVWDYAERSVLEWRHGMSFLWRQEADWKPTEGQDWYTIWNYFDRALAQLGWTRVDGRFGTPCGESAPETEFLELGNGGYVVYVQQHRQDRDKNLFCHGPDVCLAIWQPRPNSHYQIVLTSENPSFVTEYSRCVR